MNIYNDPPPTKEEVLAALDYEIVKSRDEVIIDMLKIRLGKQDLPLTTRNLHFIREYTFDAIDLLWELLREGKAEVTPGHSWYRVKEEGGAT